MFFNYSLIVSRQEAIDVSHDGNFIAGIIVFVCIMMMMMMIIATAVSCRIEAVIAVEEEIIVGHEHGVLSLG